MKEYIQKIILFFSYIIFLLSIITIVLSPVYIDIYSAKLLLFQAHLFSSSVLVGVFLFALIKYYVYVYVHRVSLREYVVDSKVTRYGIFIILILVVVQIYFINNDLNTLNFFKESYQLHITDIPSDISFIDTIQYGVTIYLLLVLSTFWLVFIIFVDYFYTKREKYEIKKH